tara:strand:- start:73 stop:204 length:132 start_codon:yes stop_codon:yes gene_type:complete
MNKAILYQLRIDVEEKAAGEIRSKKTVEGCKQLFNILEEEKQI